MEEAPKQRKRWSTVHASESGINVAGRVIIEKTIVSLLNLRVDPIAQGEDSRTYRVTVEAEIGDATEHAIVKAFTALGERVAAQTKEDGRDNRMAA